MRYSISEISAIFPPGTVVYYVVYYDRSNHILAEYTPDAPDGVDWHTPDIEARPIADLEPSVQATVIHVPGI